jgi:hypothetical protein
MIKAHLSTAEQQQALESAAQEGISPSAWVSRQLTMLLDRMEKLENTQIGDSDGN